MASPDPSQDTYIGPAPTETTDALPEVCARHLVPVREDGSCEACDTEVAAHVADGEAANRETFASLLTVEPPELGEKEFAVCEDCRKRLVESGVAEKVDAPRRLGLGTVCSLHGEGLSPGASCVVVQRRTSVAREFLVRNNEGPAAPLTRDWTPRMANLATNATRMLAAWSAHAAGPTVAADENLIALAVNIARRVQAAAAKE